MITMTPKEKAQELIDKFKHPIRWKMGQEDVLDRAKQCSLIAVDEVLYYATRHGFIRLVQYWNEVKQEIEKL